MVLVLVIERISPSPMTSRSTNELGNTSIGAPRGSKCATSKLLPALLSYRWTKDIRFRFAAYRYRSIITSCLSRLGLWPVGQCFQPVGQCFQPVMYRHSRQTPLIFLDNLVLPCHLWGYYQKSLETCRRIVAKTPVMPRYHAGRYHEHRSVAVQCHCDKTTIVDDPTRASAVSLHADHRWS